MKWLIWILGALALLVAGYIAYTRYVVNPEVEADLRANPDGERAGRAMLLTFADGRTIPVNYLEEDGKIFVGADGPWWREFRDGGAPVTLEIRGAEVEGHAVVVLNDPAYTKDIFSRLRPAAPAWLPDWLNGKLVVITPKS